MIHATIIEHYIGDEQAEERERLNRLLAGTEPEAPIVHGPMRYARPGEIARTLKTVPVHEAMAALKSRMGTVQTR